MKNNLQVTKCYSDRGISGKDIKHRPALMEQLNDASNKKFDMVLSWKINRISRKLSDVLKIVDLLEKNNITFKFYSEPFETSTPSGKMQFQMLALIGEFERGTIAQNVKMGMNAKAKSGEWCGGIVLGYDLITIPEEGTKRNRTELIINEKEAHIVRRIFKSFTQGNGYKSITNQLNKEGHRTKKGNPFSVSGVRDILLNPLYIGKIRYNVRQNWSEKRRKNLNPNPILVDGIHEPILDETTWSQAQAIFDSSAGKPARIYDGQYTLTGILKCPECGAGMVISRTVNTLKDGTKRRLVYYACGNWKNKGTSVCHSNTIRVDKANAYVFSRITELISSGKMVENIVAKINADRNDKINPAKKTIDQIPKDLQQLERRKSKLFEAFEDDIITQDDFRRRNDELNEKISALHSMRNEQEIILNQEKISEVSFELVKSILKKFSAIMTTDMTRQKQKKLLHMIISEITINEKREVDSINIKFTDHLINYLRTERGVSTSDAPLSNSRALLSHPRDDIRFSI
ncbi:MAG: recombinase family protein [Clostridiaceae bacterium]